MRFGGSREVRGVTAKPPLHHSNECGGLRLGLGSGLERGRLELEPRYILCELVVFLMLDTRFLLTLNEAS